MMPGCMELINVGHKEGGKKLKQELSIRRADLKYTAPSRPSEINTLFPLKYFKTCIQDYVHCCSFYNELLKAHCRYYR